MLGALAFGIDFYDYYMRKCVHSPTQFELNLTEQIDVDGGSQQRFMMPTRIIIIKLFSLLRKISKKSVNTTVKDI